MRVNLKEEKKKYVDRYGREKKKKREKGSSRARLAPKIG